MNTCDTCKWWVIPETAPRWDKPYRECENVGIWDDDKHFSIDSEWHAYLMTGPKFGCIHHENIT